MSLCSEFKCLGIKQLQQQHNFNFISEPSNFGINLFRSTKALS